jgi:hypothetical protein
MDLLAFKLLDSKAWSQILLKWPFLAKQLLPSGKGYGMRYLPGPSEILAIKN